VKLPARGGRFGLKQPGPATDAPGRGFSAVKVDVCVVTHRRPVGLHRLLGGLDALELPEPRPELRVVVVDNDAAESARPVCEDAARWLRHDLLYLVEKRRGIPQARNTALAAALERADFAAFIDDDEVPEPGWLAELMRVQASRGADVVAGPVEPVFETSPPAWIERGGFFLRPRYATGTRIGHAYTHNALVSMRAIAGVDRWFDERMALTGSSDTELFERLARGGARIVWADLAVVREWVPASRARLVWILRRALRVGTASSFIDRRCLAPPRPAVAIAAHGGWCVAKGLWLAAFGALRGAAAATRGLRLAAFGVGRLLGLAGVSLAEYRRTDGR
jgi:glycosyltransferase involved in cell wall biosynthesis